MHLNVQIPRLLLLWCIILSPCSIFAQTETNFARLTKEIWEYDLRENPLRATRVGDARYADQLPEVTISDESRRTRAYEGFIKQLEGLTDLAPSDQLNRDILLRLLRRRVTAHGFQEFLVPITNRQGFHIDFPDLTKTTPLETTQDYENFIARLRAFLRYASQHIELMREGIKQGHTLPSVVLEGYAEPIEAHIVEDATQSVFYEPFATLPESISAAQQADLQRQAQAAITESIVPGYRAFLEFMRDEYVPSARGSLGASALPNGRAYYRFCTRKFTTLAILPEEVHAIGQDEVQRIRQEMEGIRQRVQFDGDFAAFLHHLRTDPKFYPQTKEELLQRTAYECKRMDGELPKLFKKLPRTPYGIREIPDYIAPRTTTAYYMPPTGDGKRAGFYYVNTYQLDSRPLYGVQALTLHEAVPGHHLQLALQQELEDLPPFRRYAMFTAFVEGWALYAERLGLEVGFYKDPYDDFGRLTYEMWRACRLVVDTGIHYLGWTRSQAIEFMESNSGLSKHNIRAEVDRYIAWPGQALAYKMGELKIRELRTEAETALGPAFDVREFHDVVLRNGSVPLDVLQQQVQTYIAETKPRH